MHTGSISKSWWVGNEIRLPLHTLSNLPSSQPSDKLTPGVYAVHMTGKLPENVIDDLEASGITYTPRDSQD